MSASPSIPAGELAAESLRTIGAMVCMHVQLELNMRRFIELLLDAVGGAEAIGFTARHRFQSPLRVLKVLIRARYAAEPLKLRKFMRWRNRVNKLQGRRNTMVHGAWVDAHGRLRFRRFPRHSGARVQETCVPLSADQMASDVRLLQMDIVTIEAWMTAFPDHDTGQQVSGRLDRRWTRTRRDRPP